MARRSLCLYFVLLCLSPSYILVHAAVLAINEAVEKRIVGQTKAALLNPYAVLNNIREPLAAVYQEVLYRAKAEKANNAKNKVSSYQGSYLEHPSLDQATHASGEPAAMSSVEENK